MKQVNDLTIRFGFFTVFENYKKSLRLQHSKDSVKIQGRHFVSFHHFFFLRKKYSTVPIPTHVATLLLGGDFDERAA